MTKKALPTNPTPPHRQKKTKTKQIEMERESI
jgi:hypothetical protein